MNAGKVSYTKEETKSLSEKNLSRSTAWVETHSSGGFWHPLLSGKGQILQSGEATLPPKFPLHSMKRLPKQEPHPYRGPHQDVHLKCQQTLRSLA